MAAFIAENSTADIRLADVARAIHLHENRASSLFRQVFGSSVTDYLGQFRVAEAQRLLLTTDLTSAAVAASAGFQSLSSYHETFVRVCGTTPTRWRDGHRRG
jgi:AraC-like DNA-binding protein